MAIFVVAMLALVALLAGCPEPALSMPEDAATHAADEFDYGNAICPHDFDACGGDPIGNWRGVAMCVSLSKCEIDFVPASTPVALLSLNTTGSSFFLHTGAWSYATTFDLACETNGPSNHCSDLDADRLGTKTTCASNGDGSCTCDVNTEMNWMDVGSLQIDDNIFRIGAEGITTPFRFCVRGSALTIANGNHVYTFVRE